jgi:dethiobiotin synthase
LDQARRIYITGTNTNVGKTVFTSLLLLHLQQQNIAVLPLKPIATGDFSEVDLLARFSHPHRTRSEINLQFFRAPLTPWIAARRERRSIAISQVHREITKRSKGYDLVLVEGAGGLLSPWTKTGSFLDLIKLGSGAVVVVAPNQLGVLNQVLLTLRVLNSEDAVVVLMDQEERDYASETNAKVLREITGLPIFVLPFLPGDLSRPEPLHAAANQGKRVLQKITRLLFQKTS